MTKILTARTTLHVVIRPAGERGTPCETYAAAVRPGMDPKRAALELATDVAMYEDSTTVEYRLVLATDAGAARLQWPRRKSHSAGGSFRMADEAHTVSARYAAPTHRPGPALLAARFKL